MRMELLFHGGETIGSPIPSSGLSCGSDEKDMKRVGLDRV
jgi:hypothetical protein